MLFTSPCFVTGFSLCCDFMLFSFRVRAQGWNCGTFTGRLAQFRSVWGVYMQKCFDSQLRCLGALDPSLCFLFYFYRGLQWSSLTWLIVNDVTAKLQGIVKRDKRHDVVLDTSVSTIGLPGKNLFFLLQWKWKEVGTTVTVGPRTSIILCAALACTDLAERKMADAACGKGERRD